MQDQSLGVAGPGSSGTCSGHPLPVSSYTNCPSLWSLSSLDWCGPEGLFACTVAFQGPWIWGHLVQDELSPCSISLSRQQGGLMTPWAYKMPPSSTLKMKSVGAEGGREQSLAWQLRHNLGHSASLCEVAGVMWQLRSPSQLPACVYPGKQQVMVKYLGPSFPVPPTLAMLLGARVGASAWAEGSSLPHLLSYI